LSITTEENLNHYLSSCFILTVRIHLLKEKFLEFIYYLKEGHL
jgi:hypothetical protein